MAAPNFSVTEVVGHGVNFARANTGRVLGVLLLAAVVGGVGTGLDAAGRNGGVFNLLNWVLSIVATGALLRLAFRADQPDRADFQVGAQGFQWRNTETQLLLAALTLVFIFAMAVLALIFVLILIGVFAGLSGALASVQAAATPDELVEQLGPGLATAFMLVLLGFLCVVIWLAVRLTLYAPATVAEGRMRVFESMALTKGRFWKLLGALILASLPTILASVIAGGVVEAVGEQGEDGTKVVDLPLGLALGLITGLVVSLVQIPLVIGVYAELYRRLGPPVPAEPVKRSA